MPLARLAEVTDFVEDLVQSSSVVSFDLLMLTTQRAASVGCFFHIRQACDFSFWPDADLVQRLFLSQLLGAKRTHCAHRELF